MNSSTIPVPRVAPRAFFPPDRLFYTGMSVAILVAVFTGFARTYYLRPHFQSAPLPLYLHVHGAVFSAWIALFVVQTSLIAARRTAVHRRLGVAGAALAAVMVVVALMAAVVSGRRNVAGGFETEALAFLTTPLSSMAVFLTLVATALYYRRRADTHKRLMLLATICIIDAATARWPLAFVATSTWAYYALADVFVVAAMTYDAVTRRYIHPAYIWGGLLMVVAQVLRDVVGRTEAWQTFARMILK